MQKLVRISSICWLMGAVGAQAMQPEWEIHRTEGVTSDYVVAAYNVVDYGAVGDGVTDCTPAFVQALRDLEAIGGGTLFVPRGRYVIRGELEVPASTVIRGEWLNPNITTGVKGTVLMAYAGRGKEEGTPFITVDVCGGVKDLSIWYPEQDAGNIVPYPFTLIQKGGDNATFENLTLVNSYQGIKIGPGGNELHYVHNVYGTPLKVGVWYDSTTDIGRLEQIRFSPEYWSQSGLPGAPPMGGPHAAWMLENGTGLHMFRSDWEYVSHVNVTGYRIGFHMSEGVRGAANAQFYAMEISQCKTALQVEKTNPIGMVFTKCSLMGTEYGVRLTSEFDSVVMFAMCAIDGRNCLVSEGTGSVILQQCELVGGDVQADGGAIALSSCVFLEKSQRLVLGKHVVGASLTGIKSEPEIINHAGKQVLKVSQQQLEFSPLPALKNSGDRQFRPTAPVLYVATDNKWGVIGGDNRDDTKALQKVLDHAGAAGGGIVFLPAGDYVIRGNLVVHSGVELRGIHDVPHHTMGGGSILHVYTENDEPTIVLQARSGARGLSFNYPEQDIRHVREYPFLIQGRGEDIYVINVNAANPYKFLDLKSFRCDRHYVDYLSGGPLKVGIDVGGGARNGEIRNMQFNPHYWNRSPKGNPFFANAPGGGIKAGTDGGLYWEYQKENMDSLTVGHTENQFLFQNFVFGSLYGISFTEENGRGPENCIVHGHGTDGSKVGLYFKSGDATIHMINSELVAMASEDKIAIKLDKQFSGKTILTNTMIWGHPDIMAEVNNGELLIQSGSARHHGNGMKVNGGKAEVVNFNFNQADVHVTLPVNGELSLIGCVTPDGINVNGRKVKSDVKDGLLTLTGNIEHGRNYNNRNQIIRSPATSGLSDIDALRAEVLAKPTTAETAPSRRSALLRWWRLMWRSGQDMSPFDDVANMLLNTKPESEANWAAVDRGYAVLEEMLKIPRYITEVPGQAQDIQTSVTDWPIYGGATGHNTGYSPDAGPGEGKLAWRFPKGFSWDVVPVLEDGKIYVSSPGIDVVGFCLDEDTGEVIWRARQYGERFYGTPRSTDNAVISEDRVLVRFGTTNRQMRIYNKETGERISNPEKGRSEEKELFAYKRGETQLALGDAVTGQEIWSYNLQSGLSGEPQMVSGSVYAAGQNGNVFKFAENASMPAWRVRLDTVIRGNLSIGKTAIYAGGERGVLYALDKSDGSVLWKHDTGKTEVRAYQFFSSALEDGNRVYFGTASSEVYCIDARNGSLIWKHKVGDWVRARPVKVDDTVYAATLESRLYALKESGNYVAEKWVQNLGAHGVTADLVAGGKALLASGRDYIMYSVDYDSGAIRWRHGILDGAWIDGQFIYADYTAALPGTPTVADGVVYIGGPDGFVNAVDVETGKEIWKFEAGAVITGAVSLIDGKAVFGRITSAFDVPEKEEAPPLFAVDQKTGKPIWISREYGNIWIGPIKPENKDEVMFVGDMSGYVYGVDPDSGKKLWQYYTAKDTPQEDKPHDHHKHGWPPGVYCMPVVDDECFYVGSWSGYYFAFEHETGKLRWRTQTGWPETGGGLPDSAAPTLHKDHLYVQKQGHIIAAINIHTGNIEWEWQAPAGFLQNGTLAALGDKVYASVARRVTHIPFESWTHCFADVENGSKLLWSYPSGGALSAPVITDKQLIFGSSTGMFLTSLDPQTGELKWRLFTGGEMTENVPAIYGDMLFSVSKNGWLNAVK